MLCAALACGILKGLAGESFFKKQISLLCGLLLTFTLVSPVLDLELPSLDSIVIPFSEDAAAISGRGEAQTQDAIAAIIQQEMEAYIHSRAEALGAEVQAQVSLNEALLPKSVQLDGTVSTALRMQLSEILESELGIPKEQQIWTGHSNSAK